MATGQRFTASAPRTDRRGGWQGSPNSLAALELHRPTWGDAPRCHRCARPARSGSKICSMHGGAGTRPDSEVSVVRLARRQLKRLQRAGRLAPALFNLEVFQRTMMGRLALAPYALALAYAWDV